ncbi:MAG TPA: MBOAT family protein, partial [Chitinophagaceae bacterium]|nr:MBOAT family protein [Chitinophagaceae bacterium]
MLFNSWVFVLFWIVFFFLYWFVFNKSIKLQNAFIAIASFVFYGWWDWRFLLLLWLSLIVDFCVGYFLEIIENKSKRKLLIVLSIAFNIGLLMFFKYFNFFSNSFESLAHSFGWQVDFVTLNLILPVGISFYTFQSLSYTIEVYNKKLKGTKDIFAYAAFISFFPQLVAGPIERAANMLPQYYKKRVFNYTQSVKGMQLILWGLFKKVVVADTCAIFANNAFNNYTQHDGFNLIMGAVFFSFQIYGDFSGYTDIARGLG